MASLGEQLASRLGEATLKKTAGVGFQNARENAPHIRKTVHDLDGAAGGESAVVISAGPSLHTRHSVVNIRDSGYRGTIVAVDGSLGHCLRNGLVPHYVLTLDPHAYRIIRWFGDPELRHRPEDDYFRRQDLDPEFQRDELRKNDELIELVNRHGRQIKAIIGTCVDPGLTRRCLDAGMELYWWNPIYDDYDDPESVTRRLFEANRVPCLVTGGNCGSAAWVFAHAVLKKKHVALVGMDLGYRPGTPLLNTQYIYQLQDLLGDRAAEAFIHIRNPYLNEEWFTDPTYYWYRQVFLSMVRDAECTTYNCSEGGVVFGEGIEFVPLKEFLSRFTHG